MNFYWPDYHRLAQQLMNSPEILSSNYEATLRTVISRSYYAAFKVVINYLRDFENVTPARGDNEHWFAINYMKRSNDGSKNKIGDLLDRMRNIRNLADYQDELFSQLDRANYSINAGQQIFDRLRQITSQSQN